MIHKQYLNEKILKLIIQKLDDIKQYSQDKSAINLSMIQTMIEQGQQN
jgi:hypothetical protein